MKDFLQKRASFGLPTKSLKTLIFGCLFIFPTIFLLCLCIWFSAVFAAAPPAIITYQGKVLASGASVTTSLSMGFVLYDAESGGNALYTAAGTLPSTSTVSVTPTNGIFSIDLGTGSTNSLPPSIFQDNAGVYLQVYVNGTALSPRRRITSVGFAINSQYLMGYAATSTASTSEYIPVALSDGSFNFNTTTIANSFYVLNSTGRVGIGTNTPQFNLAVSGTLYVSATTTFGTSTLVVDAGSKFVGIGTSSPQYPLHLMGNALMIDGSLHPSAAGASVYLHSNSLYNSGIVFTESGSATRWTILSSAAANRPLYITPSGNGITGTTFTFTSAGFFGIGTTSPQFSLTVTGTSYIAGTSIFGSGLQSVGVNTSTPRFNLSVSGTAYFTATTTAMGTLLVGAVNESIATGTFVMNGNDLYVEDQLGVNGNSYFDGIIDVAGTGTSTFAGGINIAGGCFAVNWTCLTAGGSGTVNSGTAGQVPYYATNGTAISATSALFIATNGNVGVGTTTPGYKLSVSGTLFIASSSLFAGPAVVTYGTSLLGGAHSLTTYLNTSGGNISYYDPGSSMGNGLSLHSSANGGLAPIGFFAGDSGVTVGYGLASIPDIGPDNASFSVSGTSYFSSTSLFADGNIRLSPSVLSGYSVLEVGTSTPGGLAGALQIFSQAGSSGAFQLMNTVGMIAYMSESVDGWSAFTLGGSSVSKGGTVLLYNSNNELRTQVSGGPGTASFFIDAVSFGTSSSFGQLTVASTSEQLRLAYTNSAYSTFVVSSTGSLTIDPTGNTTTLASVLAVTGSSTSTFAGGINIADGCFAVNGTCLTAGGSGTVNSGTAGQLAYFASNGTAVSGTSTLFITPGSLVGVGTNAPSSTLHVVSTVGDQLRLSYGNSYYTRMQTDQNGNFIIEAPYNNITVSSTASFIVSSYVDDPELVLQPKNSGLGGFIRFKDYTGTSIVSVFADPTRRELQIDSTTTVANLLYANTFTERVGINTSTPIATFGVSGTVYFSATTSIGSTLLTVSPNLDRIYIGTSTDATPNAKVNISGAGNQLRLSANNTTQYTMLSSDSSGFLSVSSTGGSVYMPTGMKMGIGTAAPAYPLHVMTPSINGSAIAIDGTNAPSGGASLLLRPTSAGLGYISVIDTSGSSAGSINFGTTGSSLPNTIYFSKDGSYGGSAVHITFGGWLGVGTSTPRFSIATTGTLYAAGTSTLGTNVLTVHAGSQMVGVNSTTPRFNLAVSGTSYFTATSSFAAAIGINTSTPGYKLDVYSTGNNDVASFTDTNGTCTVDPTNTALSCSSDIRLKKDVKDIVYGLDTVQALHSVTFKWKNQTTDDLRIGFIAQEVEAVLPEAVSTNHNGFKSVNYNNFIPVLVKAIQEQQLQIQALQASAAVQGRATGNLMAEHLIVTASSTFEGTLAVKKHVQFNGDTVGQVKILPGAMQAVVFFEDEYDSQPIVTVTPLEYVEVPYRVSDIHTRGFTIELRSPQATTTIFNWHAFAAGTGSMVTVSNGLTEYITTVRVVDPSVAALMASQENNHSAPMNSETSVQASSTNEFATSTPEALPVLDSATTTENAPILDEAPPAASSTDGLVSP